MNDANNTHTLTFTVTAKFLRGMLECASKKDVRHFLNGVAFDVSRGANGVAVATDGHVLMVAAIPEPYYDTRRFEFVAAVNDKKAPIIPSAAIEQACKAAGARGDVEVSLTVTEGSSAPARFTLSPKAAERPRAQYSYRPSDSMTLSDGCVDGIFPDYPRVIPETVSGEPGQFDPNLIARMHKAFANIVGETPRNFCEMVIEHNGPTGAALITSGKTGDDAVGVIMPIKSDEGNGTTARAVLLSPAE